MWRVSRSVQGPALRGFTTVTVKCPLHSRRHRQSRQARCQGKTDRDSSTAGEGSDQPVSARLSKFAADVAVNPLTYLLAIIFSAWLVRTFGESQYLVLFLAGLPVVGLTALSKSPAIEQVQEELQAKLPELEAGAERTRNAWAAARASSPFFGPQRPQVPLPLQRSQDSLVGELPGDFGFDPLGIWGLSAEARRRWMQEAELLHARWAMLGIVGCVVPELLALGGADIGESVWWKVGAAKLESGLTINYAGIEGFRIAGEQGLWVIAACQVLLMGGPEYARFVGIKSLEPVGVFLPGLQAYPGGVPFDPLQLSQDPDFFLTQQVAEINAGRVAMVAMVGCAAQAWITRVGPVENLLDTVGLL